MNVDSPECYGEGDINFEFEVVGDFPPGAPWVFELIHIATGTPYPSATFDSGDDGGNPEWADLPIGEYSLVLSSMSPQTLTYPLAIEIEQPDQEDIILNITDIECPPCETIDGSITISGVS